MPGLAFPPVGRLGLTSPPSPVLCSAQTALCPSRVASLVARGPIPCLLPRVCVPYGSSWRGSTSITPGLLVSRYPSSSGDSDMETSGSLQFPSSPCEYMPRSQTPVVSRTPGSLSAGLLPSGRATPSAFPLGFNKRLSSADHDYTYCGAPSRGLHPRYTWLRTSPYENARRFAPDLGPPFGQVRLVPLSSGLTDWETITNFMGPFSCLHSQGLGFIWTRGASC